MTVTDNPYRRFTKRWWERRADILSGNNTELRRTVATLRNAVAELSEFAESMVPECACGCHELDEHCDTCCWPPQRGICPDCLDYMREPIP